MKLVKSFTNVDNDRFLKGIIIVYEIRETLCYREVEKDNTWYWHNGLSFQKPEEATEAWALELVQHPMDPPRIIDYYRSERAAKSKGTKMFPAEIHGHPVIWRVVKIV